MAGGGEQGGDRTEAPSQRKLEEAREQGRVASSREVGACLSLGAVTLALVALVPASVSATALSLRQFLKAAPLQAADPAALGQALTRLLLDAGQGAAPILLLLTLAPIAAAALQNALLWSPALLAPKFERLSPAAGLKRLFGPKTLLEFAKSLAKLAAVATAGGVALHGHLAEFLAADQGGAGALLERIGRGIVLLVGVAAAVAAVVALLDYAQHRFAFMREMRMTRREVLDEHRQSEGDPAVKQRLKSLRLERSRRRMMADVPKSTLVITNPTHYAVALRYVPGETPAPKVMAVGVDAVALRIRELAKGAGVPIVENPPLARALHASVEIGAYIPQAHYQAVAEIIGYVMRLNEARGGG